MASITIRNPNKPLKARLRNQAAIHGWSMEDEVRDIIRNALNQEPSPLTTPATAIHAQFAPLGWVDLSVMFRDPVRDPLTFS